MPTLDLSKTRHELRTPINHIIGYCEMLLEEERLPERFYQDLRHIHASGKRLLELITLHFNESTVANPKDLQALQHELRTPVNHIIGYSELLEDFATEIGLDRVVPDLNRIRDAARQWLALTEELLIPVEAAQDPNFTEGATQAPMLAFITPGVTIHTVRPRVADEPIHWNARVLVVDDDPANRDLLERRLHRYGATVTTAEDGLRALGVLRKNPVDLVLLDMLLPGLDGYQVLTKLKADEKLREIPVIMISGLDQENGIARCLEAGAEDYLTKPFNSVFLKARIGACLEKQRWREQERATHNALVKTQQRLAVELAEAAAYVKSLLPAPLKSPEVTADWRFLPSSTLGGDAFGYNWLDSEHFAVYLIDVCSHGVGAALLSISVMNVLRSRNLQAVDFRNPGQVLAALNRLFVMENQNNLYFTMWYGVFNKSTRQLSYSSAGHPPAILITGPDRPGAQAQRLRTSGAPVGTFPEGTYPVEHTTLAPFNRLFVFSDGAYEIARPDGSMLSLNEFANLLVESSLTGNDDLQATLSHLENIRGAPAFEDDLALLELSFG